MDINYFPQITQITADFNLEILRKSPLSAGQKKY